tara:strand:+ start:471 stop:746 length:276 start_codon:yes stop_codon:yes gene_type:complete
MLVYVYRSKKMSGRMNLKTQVEMFRKARKPNKSVFNGKCTVAALDTMFKYIDVLEEDLESAEASVVKATAAAKKAPAKKAPAKKAASKKKS